MTDEEKLRDIVRKAAAFSLPSNTQEFHLDMFTSSLMASGVKIGKNTNVPRWIPVTERLPTWADGTKYGGILAVRNGHELSDFYHCTDVRENPDEFTHWMPVPDPPKDGDT